MKKGFTTMEFVIAAILIIALAGTLIFVFTPRIEKAPGLVEGFFPEKCPTTGLTREQYYSAITDALRASPPQFDKAIQLRTAMRVCFPDADIHADMKEFIIEKGIKAVDFAKFDDGTTKSLREAFDKYVETKDLMSPNEFSTIALLLFSRGFYHFKGSPAEGTYLLDIVLARRGISDEQRAEAMTLKALFFEREGKLQQAIKLYMDIIDEFGKSTNPDVQLYAGIAYLQTNRPREGLSLLRSARKAKSPYGYEIVNFYYLKALYTLGDADAINYASTILDAEFRTPKFEQSVAYPDVFDAYFATYAGLPEEKRTLKNCVLDAPLIQRCVCKTPPPAILPTESRKFCCSPNKSEKECVCTNLKACRDYPTKDLCLSDICGFAGSQGPESWHCEWENNACKTEYFSAGGALY